MMPFIIENRRALLVWVVASMAGLVAVSSVYAAARLQGLDPIAFVGDAKGYVLLAENLSTQGVFSFSTEPPYMPDSFRAPGYPAFLAALHVLLPNWAVVLLVQAILMSVAPLLLYFLCKPYHERAAFWGAIVFSLEPIRLFASSVMLSDALFVALLFASLLLLRESTKRSSLWWPVLAGALLGAAILVRPIAQFLPLIFVGYVLASSASWRKAGLAAAALCIATLVVVMPWMLRNHTLFGSWSVSSVGAYNLAAYNAPAFNSYRPTPHSTEVLAAFALRQQSLPQYESLSLAREGEFKEVFLQVIRGREGEYLFFHIFKTAPFFLTDGLRDTLRLFNVEVGPLPNITSMLLQGRVGELGHALGVSGVAVGLLVVGSGFWLCVCLLSIYALYRAVRARQYVLTYLALVVVLYFALLTGPVSNARYRIPVEGFLLVAAAASVLELSTRVRSFAR